MKQQTKMRLKAGVLTSLIAFASLVATACPPDDPIVIEQDMQFTQNGITFIFDKGIKGNYSAAEINKFKGYVQQLFTVGDPFYTQTIVDYVAGKSNFKIYIKPLTGTEATDDYKIINEKELIVNSIDAPNADELFGKMCNGLSFMPNNFAQAKYLNNAITPRANASVAATKFA